MKLFGGAAAVRGLRPPPIPIPSAKTDGGRGGSIVNSKIANRKAEIACRFIRKDGQIRGVNTGNEI